MWNYGVVTDCACSGSLFVKAALRLCLIDLSAGKSHRFKCALELKGRLDVGLLWTTASGVLLFVRRLIAIHC